MNNNNLKMLRNTLLLICILSYSKETFAQTSGGISSIIRSKYEDFRQYFDKANTVSRVRTLEELRANKLALLDFIGMVEQFEGYEAEEYDVETEDGYILKLHRISSSPCNPNTSDKPVVYLQHGYASSSDQFVVLGSKHDLGYLLADAGYDVWLGNVRGNTYSRRHVNYSAASFNYDFWNFNIDDLGTIDVATLIDSVLEKTNKTKLIYIGYSMGTSINYILLSTKPEYNDKIDLSISLAPVAYFGDAATLFLKFTLIIQPAITYVSDALRIYEFFPLSKALVAISKTVCTNFIGKYLCGLIVSPLLAMQNLNFANVSSIITSYFFNGASSDTVVHLCQMANSNKFRKFDYGPDVNQEKYNCTEPPEYDLSQISAPQALFYAVHDTFVNPKGTMELKANLKNIVSFQQVPESYKHFDILGAKNVRTEYYDKVLDLVKKFS